MRGQEVVPVLQDEPDAGECGDACSEAVTHAVDEACQHEREQQARAEVPFVHAGTKNVDPWA